MSKYTKGPWTMRESNFALHIYGVFKKSKNAFITAAYWKNPDYGASREEAKANAQLIAAAPELYEAAKLVLAWYDAEEDHSQETDFYKRIEMCRASELAIRSAIKKAEGEA